MTDVSEIGPRFNHHTFVESGHIEIYDGLPVSLRVDGTCSIGTIGRASQPSTLGSILKWRTKAARQQHAASLVS